MAETEIVKGTSLERGWRRLNDKLPFRLIVRQYDRCVIIGPAIIRGRRIRHLFRQTRFNQAFPPRRASLGTVKRTRSLAAFGMLRISWWSCYFDFCSWSSGSYGATAVFRGKFIRMMRVVDIIYAIPIFWSSSFCSRFRRQQYGILIHCFRHLLSFYNALSLTVALVKITNNFSKFNRQ